jgi:predicted nucleotidyltransferase
MKKYTNFDYEDISAELRLLEKKELVNSCHGFYFIGPCRDMAELRIARQKIADRKWKKTLRAVKYMNFIPYVLAVFGSGSLALNNTKPESDLDVLIVAKGGRIWTTRMLVSLVMSLLRVRRTKTDTIAPDKICLNHYVTDLSLEIPHQSMYCAHLYAHLVPVLLRDEAMTYKFKKENDWMKNYLFNWGEEGEQHLKTLRPSPKMNKVAVFLETVLSGRVGNWLEEYFKRVQLKRINSDPNTNKSGGRATFSDLELEFHPSSPEKGILGRYNATLAALVLD